MPTVTRSSAPTFPLPRFGTPRNESRDTLGPAAAEVAKRLGIALMPAQQHVLDVALEIDPDTGQLAYREVVLTVPRQSMKTTIALVVLTHRSTRWGGRQSVTYTAQTRNAARKKWEDDHLRVLEASVFKSKFDVRRTNGSEAILWRNGSKWAIDAPSKTAGHGETLDLGFIDEAFAHDDDRVEQAMAPAMITRQSPQIWVASTAGTGQSTYLWRKILAGRAACEANEDSPTAYFEWSAAEDADIADRDVWRACSPALGHTVPMEALEAEFARAKRKGPPGLALFERAYLNRWPDVPVLDEDVIEERGLPLAAWAECLDVDQERGDRTVFALDIAPDRGWSSIGAAGTRSDGREYVELVDRRPGTGWVVERAAELVEKWGGFVTVDSVGPASSFVDRLTAAGVEVRKTTTADVARACGSFHDAVTEGQLRHFGDPALEDAVTGVRRRPLGDAWAWSRKGSTVDITPLVAVTLARWALTAFPAEDESTRWHATSPVVDLGDWLD